MTAEPEVRERARELFEGLVGRRTGVVREVFEVPSRRPDEPPLRHVGARVADPQARYGEREGLSVGGSGESLGAALIAALAEGVERYCAASFDPSALPLASREALGAEAAVVEPTALGAFSEAQRGRPGFPYQRPAAGARLRWRRARAPLGEATAWVPAAAVYLPYRPEGPEPPLCPSTSTGLCCGPTLEAATLGALCEVIERDALALTWLKRITPPPIDAARLQAVGPSPPRDDLRAYDLTSDLGVPVALVVGQGKDLEGPLLYTGSACHVDPEVALQKAWREAMQGRVYVRHLLRRPAPRSPEPVDFTEHAQLYTRRPERVEAAFAFLDGGDPAPPPAGGEGLRWLVEGLARRGLSPWVVDLSQPFCEPLGLVVVRAVLPELLPLHGHHDLPLLGHRRLAAAVEAMPRGRVTCPEGEVSPWPHPFA